MSSTRGPSLRRSPPRSGCSGALSASTSSRAPRCTSPTAGLPGTTRSVTRRVELSRSHREGKLALDTPRGTLPASLVTWLAKDHRADFDGTTLHQPRRRDRPQSDALAGVGRAGARPVRSGDRRDVEDAVWIPQVLRTERAALDPARGGQLAVAAGALELGQVADRPGRGSRGLAGRAGLPRTRQRRSPRPVRSRARDLCSSQERKPWCSFKSTSRGCSDR